MCVYALLGCKLADQERFLEVTIQQLLLRLLLYMDREREVESELTLITQYDTCVWCLDNRKRE